MLCLEEWGWPPSKFLNLPVKEQAAVAAMIENIAKRRRDLLK